MFQPKTEADFDRNEGKAAKAAFLKRLAGLYLEVAQQFSQSPEYRNARAAFRDRVNGQGARRS